MMTTRDRRLLRMRRALAAAMCALAIGCARANEPKRTETGNVPPAEQPAEATVAPRTCALIELTPLRVARIDEPQRRLFLVGTDAGEGTTLARIHDLDACYALTDWAGRWSLGVFDDAGLARYKDDPKVETAVADGRWARAYTAEYDAATRRLTRRPASDTPVSVVIR